MDRPVMVISVCKQSSTCICNITSEKQPQGTVDLALLPTLQRMPPLPDRYFRIPMQARSEFVHIVRRRCPPHIFPVSIPYLK
jgi:hypothetical protein